MKKKKIEAKATVPTVDEMQVKLIEIQKTHERKRLVQNITVSSVGLFIFCMALMVFSFISTFIGPGSNGVYQVLALLSFTVSEIALLVSIVSGFVLSLYSIKLWWLLRN